MCEFSDKVDAAKAAISAVSAQQARDLQASGVTFVAVPASIANVWQLPSVVPATEPSGAMVPSPLSV